MTAKVKDGKALEQLVGIIEQVVAGNENVTVEPDSWLVDKVTGEERQFDVVLTIKHRHHTVVIAIECRDQSRPVGVPAVEAFDKKCEHTGVNKRVIVSTKGFAGTARKKAAFLGIECLDIEEVASFDWLLAPGFRSVLATMHEPGGWTFFPETEGIVQGANFELLDEEGRLFTPAILQANARRILNEHLPELPSPIERGELRIRVNGQGLTLRNPQTGATTPVRYCGLRMVCSVSHTLSPHHRVRYLDKANGKHITDAVVSEFQHGDKTMRMVIVYRQDEGGEVYLTVAPSKKKTKRKIRQCTPMQD
jgi:restriction endonuclease